MAINTNGGFAMNLKKYFILTFLLLVLFVVGCTSETTTTEGYYGCFSTETSMIGASFDEYAPIALETSTYQPGEEIDVTIVLENKMPEDIDAGKVKVKLLGDAAVPSIFSGAQVVASQTLYGIDKDTCLLTDEEVDVGPITYLPELTTKISKEIAGLYCYEHPVEVHALLYFTKDPDEIGENLPSGANPPSGVRITKIEQDPVDVDKTTNTASLRFKVYIQNTGTGTVIESLDDCFEYRDLGFREDLKVSVDGAYNPECQTDIRLSRDLREDIISCTVSGIDTTNLGPQASEITLTLYNFAYEDSIEPVTVWLEP